jgi:hypothetical protein
MERRISEQKAFTEECPSMKKCTPERFAVNAPKNDNGTVITLQNGASSAADRIEETKREVAHTGFGKLKH